MIYVRIRIIFRSHDSSICHSFLSFIYIKLPYCDNIKEKISYKTIQLYFKTNLSMVHVYHLLYIEP